MHENEELGRARSATTRIPFHVYSLYLAVNKRFLYLPLALPSHFVQHDTNADTVRAAFTGDM